MKKKKYNKKYYTGGRVDMSKGGRVKAQVGGIQKAPTVSKKAPTMSIEREEEIRPTVQPTTPVQPKPVLSPPPKGSNRRITAKEEAELASLNVKNNQIIRNASTGNQQTTTTREKIASLKGPSASTPQQQVPKRPNFIGRKGSDQMFIGRTDEETREVQPTSKGSGFSNLLRTTIDKTKAKAEEAKAAQAQTTSRYGGGSQQTGTPMSKEDFFKQYGDYQGFVRGSKAAERRNEFNAARQQAYEAYLRSFANTGTGTGTGGTPITGTPEQLEAERGKRVIQTGRTAEQIAAGEIPEGMIPTAEVEKVSMEGTEAPTVTLDPTQQAVATLIGQQAPEQVEFMTAGTAKTPEQIEAAQMIAAQITDKPDVQAAIGELSPEAIAKVNEIRELSGPAVAAQISENIANAAKAENVDGVLSAGAFVPEVTAGVNVQVNPTPDAERQEREAITGEAATTGEAAQIIGQVGYEASKQRVVKGTAAKGAAAAMIAETGALPPDIAAAIVEDPATVEAQVDTNPVEVNAAIAALPTEALVSSQIETLLGGMEDGEVPLWAKPAVDSVNAMLAQRGMSASTVGRDALFNSIIQSALPIAQSNAQALQQRAAQNLSNEQQANLQQATQEQQLRLQNLANRQTAESQTAQFAQQMGVMQSQFRQDAVMTSAQMQQQMRMQNLQNQQQAAVINVQNQQAMNAQNLGNEQQVNLAELQIEAQVEGANQAAENQERLTEMQIAADFLAKNAAFKQDMERANLSNEQQMRLANLSALNQAGSENLSAAQQTELANLNKQMQLNIRNADLAQQMGLAQLNVDQQRAMQNASIVANMDMANFSADQQRELANSKFMQTVAITNMNAEQQAIMQNATAMASLDLATADQRTKLAISNAQNFLQMDMSNLNNQQQANMMKAQQEQQRLLSNQSAENAARQFNAASENQTNQFMAGLEAQMNQFNTAQLNAAKQFNVQSQNAANARDAQRTADVNKANAAILNQVNQFNAQLDFQRGQWNAANEQAVINSNVNWRRQANLADTAAQNAVNQQNAQNAFNLTSSAQSFLWQELRDQADYDFRFAENNANRKLQAMIAAAGSEGDAAKNWSTNFNNASSTIDRIFGQG